MATGAQPAPRVLHGGTVVVVPPGLVLRLGPDRLRQVFARMERLLESERLTKIGAEFALNNENHATDVQVNRSERLG